jgi:hypothetical protein
MKWSLLIPAAISTLYCTAVAFAAHGDRTSQSGGFISLRGMSTWLATLPGSLLFDPMLGHFDVTSNIHVGVSMLLSAALIFGILFLLLKVLRVS